MKDPYRYFRLDGAEGGAWPDGHPLSIGSIVRINLSLGESLPSNAAWNNAELAWVHPEWTEIANPALVGSLPSDAGGDRG